MEIVKKSSIGVVVGEAAKRLEVGIECEEAKGRFGYHVLRPRRITVDCNGDIVDASAETILRLAAILENSKLGIELQRICLGHGLYIEDAEHDYDCPSCVSPEEGARRRAERERIVAEDRARRERTTTTTPPVPTPEPAPPPPAPTEKKTRAELLDIEDGTAALPVTEEGAPSKRFSLLDIPADSGGTSASDDFPF